MTADSRRLQPFKVLTIGGSDSGGAAGIQADLKTFTALGVYGMSAISVVTAQNSLAVHRADFLSPDGLEAQIRAVLDDYGVDAVKSGFIGRVDLIEAAATALANLQVPLVVDPVLVNHRGQPMFGPEVSAAYRRHLFPLATVITPNWREGLLLAKEAGEDEAAIRTAARKLTYSHPFPLLFTGYPQGDEIVDFFVSEQGIMPLVGPRIATNNTHGSGDTLSAAIAVFLARGTALPDAITQARAFTARAIAAGAAWQLGGGHGPLAQWLA